MPGHYPTGDISRASAGHYGAQRATADAFSSASAALAAALLAATSDPADAIRLLLPLCAWQPPALPGHGPLWIDAEIAQAALAAQLRSSACAALARATMLYQPVSYQDANAVRHMVCATLDAEAIRAADAGRDASYLALRNLRTAVAVDLALRGAYLAELVDVTTRVPMPSLAQAWTLYQDTTREPQLVGSAAPAHPLFLPLDFPALAR